MIHINVKQKQLKKTLYVHDLFRHVIDVRLAMGIVLNAVRYSIFLIISFLYLNPHLCHNVFHVNWLEMYGSLNWHSL